MSENEIERTGQTLGAFLKETRESANISLEEVRSSTKISPAILSAMEQDDFDNMPAEAFCRGFYVMYAKFLGLDHDHILERYLDARGLPPVNSNLHSTPPVRKSGQFRSYAEPSSVPPMMNSIIVVIIIIAIAVGGCWYFKWNPLRFVQDKLSSLQQKEEVTEAPPSVPVIVSEPLSSPPSSLVSEPVPEPESVKLKEQHIPTMSEEVDEQHIEEGDTEESAIPSVPEEDTTLVQYNVEIRFHTAGTLKASVDNGFMIDKAYQVGETMEWEVKETIILELPENIEASILMNGIEIPLPEVKNGLRRLSLPEDLLN